MAIEVFNRYENKYLIHPQTFENIQRQLMDYMELDAYCKMHEFYSINNLYFDTPDNSLIRKSIAKPPYKEKLRLRSYGVPNMDTKVYLEIKKKFNRIVNKRRTALKLHEAYDFTDTGRKPEIKEYMNNQVINEIDYLLSLYDVEPRLFLAYDRRAFFNTDSHDLRITFDTNIRSRRDDLKLENGTRGTQLLPENQILMEIKTAKCFPYWLSKLLSENKVFSTSFSKYGKEYETYLNRIQNTQGGSQKCLIHSSQQPQLQLIPQYL